MNGIIELTEEFKQDSVSAIIINETKETIKVRVFIQAYNGTWFTKKETINKNELVEI